jgi:glycerate dehydrogenase
MLFYIVEHLRYYDSYVREGRWADSDVFTNIDRAFFEISGKKWGIIGLGEIGREVAKIATAFGSDISYYSTSGANSNPDYKRVELDELLKESDIITIHAPLNENTKNLLNYQNLTKIKDKAILINVGRGGIINEIDLSKIIDERNIYVGLDVLEIEPIRSYNPLNMVDNKDKLFITPHIAWASFEARELLIKKIVKNIEDFLGNGN